MGLIVAGLSHRTAPVEIREKLVYRAADADKTLGDLQARGAICEGVVLSTCNRTEIYAVDEVDLLTSFWEAL